MLPCISLLGLLPPGSSDLRILNLYLLLSSGALSAMQQPFLAYENLFIHLLSVTSLPAITTSISCYILQQLLVPIYNRSALQIVFGELIAVDRPACHSYRIESFGLVDWVWQSPLLFKRAG